MSDKHLPTEAIRRQLADVHAHRTSASWKTIEDVEPRDLVDIIWADADAIIAEVINPLIAELERTNERLSRAVERVRALHYPRSDGPSSLVDWSYCSCGAMETFIADDGYASIGPVRYPCATARALNGDDHD